MGHRGGHGNHGGHGHGSHHMLGLGLLFYAFARFPILTPVLIVILLFHS